MSWGEVVTIAQKIL